MIRALFFDWGNTVMIDFSLPGPMVSWDRVAWVPGAKQALEILSEQYPCYMATNAPLSDAVVVHCALQRIGAERYFRKIFSSSDLGVEKPHMEFFRTILKETRLMPHEGVMIGDNYDKDIVGAKKAEMKTVFYNHTLTNRPVPMADLVITDMGRLPGIIERLL
jgi:FMN phosphatase YigB (HAD superfamily)